MASRAQYGLTTVPQSGIHECFLDRSLVQVSAEVLKKMQSYLVEYVHALLDNVR
jgi:hypothetical protein